MSSSSVPPPRLPNSFSACLQLPLEAEPGTRAEYSDPGFILLGKALEVRLAEMASESSPCLIQPRDLRAPRNDVHRFLPATGCAPLIPPTEEDTTFRHRRIQGEVQDENAWLLDGVAGHAGLFSNVPDLLRFAAEILNSNPKKFRQEKANLFDAATVELFAERRGPRAVPARSAGIRHRELIVRTALFASFHRTSGLQRLFPMDRS